MRLAYEQGLLRQPNLNHFQHFALGYWFYLESRAANENLRKKLELECFHLFPDRWRELYSDDPDSVVAPAAEQDVEVPVDDIDAINQWYAEHEESRTMTGAAAMSLDNSWPPPADENAWGDWQ